MNKELVRKIFIKKIINEDVKAADMEYSVLDYFRYKRKCEITPNILPDWFLAIFFGKSIKGWTGKSVNQIAQDMGKMGTVKVITNQAHVTEKFVTTPVGDKTIDPFLANTIRDALTIVIDFIVPVGSHIFCDQIEAMVKFIQQSVLGFQYIFGLGGRAKSDEDPSASGIDISGNLETCFSKVSRLASEAIDQGSRGNLSVSLIDMNYLFFPETCFYLTSAIANADDIKSGLKNDLSLLDSKFGKIQRIRSDIGLFNNFFDIALKERLLLSKGASWRKKPKNECQAEIDAINVDIQSKQSDQSILDNLIKSLLTGYKSLIIHQVEEIKIILTKKLLPAANNISQSEVNNIVRSKLTRV